MNYLCFDIRKTLLILITVSLNVFAQNGDEDSTYMQSFSWFAYPFLIYSPETNLALGAGGILSFRLSDRYRSNPSSVTASGYYSINNQYDITILPEVYLAQDKFKVWSKFNYGRIFDYFYGIGNRSSKIENDKYLQENFLIQLKFQTKIFDERFNLGINYEFRRMNVVNSRGNPFLESGPQTGKCGGTTSGIGIAVSWDSRNNIFYPSSGAYYEFSSSNFTKFLGSNFDYSKFMFDFRRYFSLNLNHIIAIQTYFMIVTGSPPFYDLALLGGDKLMRGYITGRYRDKNYYVLQVEYRTPPIWKFRLVFFGGAGDVASDISRITISTIKPTYGIGVRFRFDELEKLDLRMDVGFGKQTNGVYFGVNQAF